MTSVARECHEFREALLLTETLSPPSAHAELCAECRRFFEAELQISSHVRRAAARLTASVDLRERVASIFAARREASGALARRTLVVAAGVGVALASGAWWLAGSVAAHRADRLARLMVEDHLEYSRRGPEKLQVANSSPTELEAFFAAEVRLAVTLPALAGATIVGGRRCSLEGRPAALVFLEHGPGPLSLFVVESDAEDWGPGVGPRRLRQRSLRGVGVVVWEERGLTYALTGAEEPAQLLTLFE